MNLRFGQLKENRFCQWIDFNCFEIKIQKGAEL